jgi:hypothetical protein
MTIAPSERKTSIAHMVRVRPDYLEVVYTPGCTLTAVSLKEIRDARRELMGQTPYAMLSLLPEDIDFELGAMNLAIAVVTRTNMIEMVLKLYFSYYPLLTRLLVTDKEAEARAWLDVQFEELGRAGS